MTQTAIQQEDQIITTVAMGAHASGEQLSRDAFLDQYPGTWQELLRTGMSKYIRADGITLSKAEGLRAMKVYFMCRNVRQRVAARMAERLADLTSQKPARPAAPVDLRRNRSVGRFPAA